MLTKQREKNEVWTYIRKSGNHIGESLFLGWYVLLLAVPKPPPPKVAKSLGLTSSHLTYFKAYNYVVMKQSPEGATEFYPVSSSLEQALDMFRANQVPYWTSN